MYNHQTDMGNDVLLLLILNWNYYIHTFVNRGIIRRSNGSFLNKNLLTLYIYSTLNLCSVVVGRFLIFHLILIPGVYLHC